MIQLLDVDPYLWPACHDDTFRCVSMTAGKGARKIIQMAKPTFPGHRLPRVPVRGYRDESAPAVMERKIDAAVKHGVNIFTLDSYCPDSTPFTEEAFNQHFIKAGNSREIKSVERSAGAVRRVPAAVDACSAFTLLEMLVTLAIVAVLAALIFLGVSSAQERSAIAQSSSNLRQLGLLAQQYAADNNGFLPVRDFGPNLAFNWLHALYPMAYGKPFPGWVPATTGANLKGTIFDSPMMKPKEGTPLRSYGINDYLARKPSSNQTEPDNRLRLAALIKPAATLLFADARHGSNLTVNTSPTPPTTSRKIQFRNNGRALMCFVDGHVESRLPSEVPTNQQDVFWSGK